VLRWARTPQHDAKSALAMLQGSVGLGGKRLLVLNQLEGPESHYRTRYSGYYEEA